MEETLRKIEQALIDAGYPTYHVRMGSIKTFKTPSRFFGVSAGPTWQNNKLVDETFETLEGLCNFVMALTPRNPIIYRQFKLIDRGN